MIKRQKTHNSDSNDNGDDGSSMVGKKWKAKDTFKWQIEAKKTRTRRSRENYEINAANKLLKPTTKALTKILFGKCNRFQNSGAKVE